MPRTIFSHTPEQILRWATQARAEKVSIAEWIRRACDARAEISEGIDPRLVPLAADLAEEAKLRKVVEAMPDEVAVELAKQVAEGVRVSTGPPIRRTVEAPRGGIAVRDFKPDPKPSTPTKKGRR